VQERREKTDVLTGPWPSLRSLVVCTADRGNEHRREVALLDLEAWGWKVVMARVMT
jgi:hypothetical protein